ncbi:hypothetical protein [Devosia rhizoryzae]|uniref:Uncharacterized protein n=1 Tax=Devosia rhizoryzae TaxID=2774137 RepID=A0ABX7C1D4_9HYPH|nr:hypothetical protein [Devosia rhizoryzae]QQR38044.1 hypothetical protein JI748_09560 [Devosia rhizoryzae]
MERVSQVLDVTIEQDGQRHHASYYVERDVIHAQIEGKVMEMPLGRKPAAETVKGLLSGFWIQRTRQLRHVSAWAGK